MINCRRGPDSFHHGADNGRDCDRGNVGNGRFRLIPRLEQFVFQIQGDRDHFVDRWLVFFNFRLDILEGRDSRIT